jgi:hypothetical protein
MDDIKNQKASAAALARAFDLPYHRTLALAHAWRDCERFVKGVTHPPLESYCASAPVPPMKPETETVMSPAEAFSFIFLLLNRPREDDYLKFVTDKVVKWFDGKIPAVTNEQFAEILSLPFETTVLANRPQSVRDAFAGGILQAVRDIREAEGAWVN